MLLIGTSIVANFLITPLFAVVFPVYAKQIPLIRLPRSGVLETAFRERARCLTTLLYGVVGPRVRRFPTLAVCSSRSAPPACRPCPSRPRWR